MFIKASFKHFLTALLVLITSMPTIHASALFDGTAADAWLIDTETGQVIGYDIGRWLEQYEVSDYPGVVLDGNNAVLVNHIRNSSVPMTPGQPAVSLAGIGDSALSVSEAGAGGYTDLILSPETGTFDETIAVTIQVSAALLEQGAHTLNWTVGAQPQKSVELDAQNIEAAQNGYYTHTFYLVADGSYPVTVTLRTAADAIVATATSTYTIATCVVPMDAQACADLLRRDTDGDSLPDIVELDIGLNPLENDWNVDLDGDGWSELDEWLRRFCLDPNTRQPMAGNECLDADGLPVDTDMDNWSDFDEILRGTNHLDPEPVIDGVVITPPADPVTLPYIRFCAVGDTFHFNLEFENSSTEVIFGIGASGFPFGSSLERIRMNFDQNGDVSRDVFPEVQTFDTPLDDRWLDGLISDFTLESLSAGVWRIHGSVPVGADPFLPGDTVPSVAFRGDAGNVSYGSLVVSGNLADCDASQSPATSETIINELVSKQRLRFKDFPSVSRLYEVEYQIDNGLLDAPLPAALNPDQQSQGVKQAEYGNIVVQSFTAVEDNIAGVDVVVAADVAASVDDITLNIWSGSLRGELLHSQTLSNVKIDTLLDSTIPFRFEAIALQPGQLYYLEFRKQIAKLATTGIDSYVTGEVLEADNVVVAGQPDLIFTTYSDGSFNNGIGGTPAGMLWRTAVAATINGKQLYSSDNLLSLEEITQASLTSGEIAARLRLDASGSALASNALPAMRLPAGDSVVINAAHQYVPLTNGSFDTPLGYSRMYKSWLPGMPDVTPVSMLQDIGQGSWTTAEEWRNAFVAYLLPRLTLADNPQLDVDSTLTINTIEAALTEESYLQGLSKLQLFASLSQTGDPSFANEWEQSLRRFNAPAYSLDQAINDVSVTLAAGQLLADQGNWLRTTFFAAEPGTRSDEYITRLLRQSYNSDCFVRDELLAELQADETQWNDFFDACPDYYTETLLNQYIAEDQLRRYQLRLILLPDAANQINTDATLLQLSTDSDSDGIENQAEIDRPVNRLTLPWLEDSDGDLVPDGLDPCTNDPLNECSSNPVLPVIIVDADFTVVEPSNGSDTAIVGIRLDRIYDEAVTVFYETLVDTGDTATAGVDFTSVSGSVVIAPGQLTALIEVPVFADGSDEGSETFSFQIVSVDNATIGDDGSVLITLDDVNVLYTIGGNVTGLTGTVVLQNNNSDDLSISADGGFTFITGIADGLTYNVTILTQPGGQTCTPTSNSGTVNGSNIINVALSCINNSIVGAPTNFAVSVTDPKTLSFSWDAVAGATSYKLLKNPDGSSGFTEVFTGITLLNVDESIPVHLQDWVNASYIVQACNAEGCTDSTAITATSAMISAIGYFKASNSGVDDDFGISLALSADGNTMAVGARGEGSNATGVNGDQSNNDAEYAGAVYVFARSGNTWLQQAYLKASNTDANDRFGRNLVLSADGNTLAVGASDESSIATGIDGDQSNSIFAEYSGAVYVFTRSGVSWSQQAYVKASNTELDDQFGTSLALSDDGNTLAVGATAEASNATGINGNQNDNSARYSGAVYIFIRNAGTWSQQAYIKASNTEEGDYFGYSVALSYDGDTLVVGANHEESNATGINGDQSNNDVPSAGAVYVYTRSVSTWLQQAYIKASNAGLVDLFGHSLALSADGNTLAVGATREDSPATGINGSQVNSSTTTDSGAVYVFIRNAAVWTQQSYIKASNTGTGDFFGHSLALSANGDTLVAGAINEDSDAIGINGDQNNDATYRGGAVYIFNRSVNVWSQSSYIKASNTGLNDIFGFSLDLSSDGSTLSVGASRESSNPTDSSAPQSGAVYLY